jgi:hypothetical protein
MMMYNSIGTIGTSTGKILSTAYSAYTYVARYFVPEREGLINGNGGLTSIEISSILENYLKMQARRKSTDLILTLESEYYDELTSKIDQLKMMEGDDYLSDWIILLEKRQLDIKSNISILENNKMLYSNIPSITGRTPKAIVSDDDEFWLCTICEDNRKNTALNCGHVFCNVCVERLNKCPNCKVIIQKDVIKQLYL